MKKRAYTTEEITRYLLGEATEAEQDTFSEAILGDSKLHTQVEERETELIDNYVRGHLEPPLRARFERRQATNPALRRRVSVAQVLLPKLEQQLPPHSSPLNWWQSLVASWQAQALGFKFASALISLLFIASGFWLLNENRRLRDALADLQTAQSAHTQSERQLAEQAEAQRIRNDQLVAELEQLRQQLASTPPMQTTPAPTLYARLTLTASGVSGSGATSTPQVTLTAAHQQLRLSLHTLPGKQPRYRAALLTAADSRLIWAVENLKPANRNHSIFTLVVPARRFSAGEYVVKVEGLSADGDTFTLLSTNFVVVKP